MSKPVVLRPEAEADVVEIWSALAANSPHAARQFLVRLRTALDQIGAWPQLYAIDWQDVRVAPVPRFKYLVRYIDQPAVVDVLAVMHGSRDASAWQSRV